MSSLARDAPSMLDQGSWGWWVQVATFIVTGVLIIAAATVMPRAPGRPGQPTWPWATT